MEGVFKPTIIVIKEDSKIVNVINKVRLINTVLMGLCIYVKLVHLIENNCNSNKKEKESKGE